MMLSTVCGKIYTLFPCFLFSFVLILGCPAFLGGLSFNLLNKRSFKMNESTIEVKFGEFSFSGSGDQQWLSGELDKILSKASDIIKLNRDISETQPKAINQNAPTGSNEGGQVSSDLANKALAKFLSDTNATKVQNDKFLATAIWLDARGKKRMTTSDVSSALKDAQQTKINKPSQCFSQNISKGYCEKDGSQFFVTEDGKKAIGL